MKTHIGRLDERLPEKEPVEHIVDRSKNACIASEVGGQAVQHSPIRKHLVDHAIEGLHVGPAKGIDRLLGIADDEKLSWFERHVLPGHGCTPRCFGESQEYFVLDRIRVLKLIDQDGAILALDPFPDVRMVPKEPPGTGQ